MGINLGKLANDTVATSYSTYLPLSLTPNSLCLGGNAVSGGFFKFYGCGDS